MELMDKYIWTASIFAGLAIAFAAFALTSRLVGFFAGQKREKTDGRDSLLISLLEPFAAAIEANPKYKEELEQTRFLLSISGPYWGGLTAGEVIAARFVMPVIGAAWGIVMGVSLQLPFALTLVLSIFAGLVTSKLPADNLKSQVKKQRYLFMKQFPGALDLLLISVKSGMDLRGSIVYLAQNYIDGPVKKEFRLIEHNVLLGESLADSLMEMADRINQPPVTSLTISLTQAIETGTSMAGLLDVATQDIRKQRLVQAKTDAQTATVKIAFPMLFLIIPGIFIVLLGPVCISLISNVFNNI